jgi:hypothetical protein
MDDPVETFADLPRDVQPEYLVCLFEVDIIPPVPT